MTAFSNQTMTRKQVVIMRENSVWPWGFKAVRYNVTGVVAWAIVGSSVEDVRKAAELQARCYCAEFIDKTL